MRTLYGVARVHNILIVICSYLLALLDIFDILALALGFGNKYDSPISVVVLYFDNAAVRLDAGVFYKKGLAQFGVYGSLGFVYFLFGNAFSVPQGKLRVFFFNEFFRYKGQVGHIHVVVFSFVPKDAYCSFGFLVLGN